MPRPAGSKNVKSIAWDKLGDFITNQGATRLIQVMKDMDDKEFVATYSKMLSYFKPKQLSTAIKQDGDINISISKQDKALLDEV